MKINKIIGMSENDSSFPNLARNNLFSTEKEMRRNKKKIILYKLCNFIGMIRNWMFVIIYLVTIQNLMFHVQKNINIMLILLLVVLIIFLSVKTSRSPIKSSFYMSPELKIENFIVALARSPCWFLQFPKQWTTESARIVHIL